MKQTAKTTERDAEWSPVCDRSQLLENAGVAALVNGEQIALFLVVDSEDQLFALGNYDPIGKANVISRGIVGDINGEHVVASPLYKQHFRLSDGQCVEHEEIALPCYETQILDNRVWIRQREAQR